MTDAAFAELEIGIHRWNIEAYSVELRFSQPDPRPGDADEEGRDADVVNVTSVRGVQFDIAGLRARTADPKAYGQLLSDGLFAHPKVQTAFAIASDRARKAGIQLRLRLFVGPSAPELHGLRWETLRDPRLDGWLVTSEHILFSRYLSSLGYFGGDGWQRVRLRPRSDLTALVVIANPAGLQEWNLTEVDLEGERARAETGLVGLDVSVLASRGAATLTNLVDHLREGCDVLYLVCHGAMVKGEAQLWLEDEAGNAKKVDGSDLVERLGDLPQLPRLVVLASCQSAGAADRAPRDDSGEFLRALGPRLAEAGVPAVLAMQGNFSMETAKQFLPKFFTELQRDGQIDRAVAVARGDVRDRADSWMPVLFMRLRTGRLWYAPGFGEGEDFRKWPALLASIRAGRVTPILGSGLTDALLGSNREIAQRWADQHHFPMSPHERGSLPQVAQYLAIDQALAFPAMDLEQNLRTEMLRRHGGSLPEELRQAKLVELASKVWEKLRDADEAEPHAILAKLPVPLFITTVVGNSLADALRDAGKDPQVEICRWNEVTDRSTGWVPSVYDTEPDYRPTVDRPLVYHVFGHLDYQDSLVLTEDDYFDYLIGLMERKDQIPKVVWSTLASTSLLFLGFQMDDWNFRILFRTILNQQGSELRRRLPHVALQLEFEEEMVVSPGRARSYLEEYFQRAPKDYRIDVFWGSVEDFAKELLRYQQRGAP